MTPRNSAITLAAGSAAIACLVASLSLTTAASAGDFRAGAAKVDVTPPVGVSLDGPISKNGPVRSVHDALHARALVLDDGTTRVAIVICDACMIGQDVFDHAKSIVSESGGIRPDHLLMAATHTHAAPRAAHIGTGPIDEEYHQSLARRIAQAVLQAEKHLVPAQLGYGSFDKTGLIQCRRSLCEPGSVGPNPFGGTGERIKSVSGSSSAVLGPAGPVDPQVSLVSVQHADGRPLAVLGNFSVHYCGGYQRGAVSADYFGYFAESIEARLPSGRQTPVIGIMSNGTSGNTGSFSRSGRKYDPFEGMQIYGRMLADEAIDVIGTIEHRRELTLQMRETELELAVRRPDAQRIAWAEQVLADRDAKQVHRWTPVYAQEALHLSKFPAQMTIKLQAIRIGDLAIAAAPCEVFAETGLAIKQGSPHGATFTIELANGYGGYLPPREQHELGGYETWPARSSFLQVDAERKIREALLKLLRDLKTDR